MDVLSVIATCGLHGDVTLVIAMAMMFSHGNPYMVQDVAKDADDAYVEEEGESLRLPVARAPKAPRTRAEAEAQLRSIVSDKGAPVVGLLPVPVSWAGIFGRTPSELFNPCVNVSIATAKLSEFEYECGGSKGTRDCVLQRYAEAAAMEDFGQDVTDELDMQGMSKQGPAVIETQEMLSAQVQTGAEDRDRQWGADRLFFAWPTAQSPKAAKSGSRESPVAPAKK